MVRNTQTSTAREIAGILSDAPLEKARVLIERYAEDPRKQVQRAVEVARRRVDREMAERRRVEAMYDLQTELGGTGLVLGVDEVGRGALAGPLTVAAVCLPSDPIVWGINDSKPQGLPTLQLQSALRTSSRQRLTRWGCPPPYA